MTDVSNPFDDWDVNQRYYHRSGITSEVIEKHRQAAIKTRQGDFVPTSMIFNFSNLSNKSGQTPSNGV